MTEDPQYRYWAFISYSRSDARVARRLIQELKRQRVPKDMRQEVRGASSHFEEIFLDTSDAGADHSLAGELEEALAASRRLIVICSPFSAQSGYVADEIRYFQKAGRAADILCLIASGYPDAPTQGKPQLDCFPAPLRESPHLPLAAAIGQESKKEWKHAADQLTAGLAGVSLGEYQDRKHARRRRMLTGAGVAATVLASALGWLAWAWVLPHTSYATDMVRRHGIWEPIGLINAEQMQGRIGWRFVRRGAYGLPVEVRGHNEFGECTTAPIESITGDAFKFQCSASVPCAAQFEYAQGQISKERIVDQFGSTVETVTYDKESPGIAVIKEAVIGCSRRASSIEFVEIERDSQGLDKRLKFKGGKDKAAVANSDYAYALAYDYSPAGQITRRTLLDAGGAPMVGRTGYASLERSFSPLHEVLEERTLDAGSKPADSSEGYARTVWKREKNAITEMLYGADGQPGVDKDGLFATRRTFVPAERKVTSVFLDKNLQATTRNDGAASTEITYDTKGRTLEVRFRGLTGEGVPGGKTSCFIERSTFEESADGSYTETDRCLDAKAQPMIARNGVHAAVSIYSASGQLLEKRFQALDGKLAYCFDTPADDTGCPVSRMVNRFDKQGNRISVRLHAPDGALAVNGQGVAGWDVVYDTQNYERRTIYIGPTGQPAAAASIAQVIEYEYDALGRNVRIFNRDGDGRLVNFPDGYAAEHNTFDAQGRLIESRRLDTEGRLKADKEGVAIQRYKRDAQGRAIEVRNFGSQEQPVADEAGWFARGQAFDRFSRVVLFRRLSANGAPEAGVDGIAAVRLAYDRHGNQIAQETLGTGDSLVANQSGVARTAYTYDDRGNLTETRYFGSGGQAVANTQGTAFVRSRYDERSRKVEETFFGIDGNPRAPEGNHGIATTRWMRDERGRALKTTFYDTDNKPRATAEGRFGWSERYNERDQPIEEVSLGADGAPYDSPDHVAITRFAYDAFGRNVSKSFLHANGQPPTTRWAAQATIEYDEYSRLVRSKFADPSGAPILHPNSGRAEAIFVYDDHGRQVEERSLGIDGRPVNRRDTGWAVKRYRYDSAGRVKLVCEDTGGKPVARCSDGE